MPIATTAIMAATAVAGLGMSAYSMYDQNKAQGEAVDNQNATYKLNLATAKKMSGINLAIEALKGKQANLDYMRNRREIIRNTIKAQAESMARANFAGGLQSSSYQGARANILRESGAQQLALYENKKIGDSIAAKNKQAYNVQAKAGILGTNLNMQGANIQGRMMDAQAIGNLGSMLFNNAQTIGQIGDTLINGVGSQDYAQFNNPWDANWSAT